jgi:hypothetical protein
MSVDPLVQLKAFGRCLDRIEDKEGRVREFPSAFEKVCFVVVDSNSVFRQKLGPSPMNDAHDFASTLYGQGYAVYFLGNPVRAQFLKFFDSFLCGTTTHLVLFYSGHGNAQKHKTTGAWTASGAVYHPIQFADGDLDDADIAARLESLRQPGLRVTFVTDCCEPESIWCIGGGEIHGVNVGSNVVSLSATIDDDFCDAVPSFSLTAISRPRPPRGEDAMLKGKFIAEVCKWLKKNPQITGKELLFSIRKVMKAHGQKPVIGASSPELMSVPLFG